MSKLNFPLHIIVWTFIKFLLLYDYNINFYEDIFTSVPIDFLVVCAHNYDDGEILLS